MDARRFDALTRRVGSARSRRSLLAGLAGGSLLLADAPGSEAACKPQGSYCKKAKQCCSDICTHLSGSKKKKCWCAALEQLCSDDRNCCAVPSGMRCQQKGSLQQACCLDFASGCAKDLDCCGNQTCGSAGRCCSENQQACSSDRECCPGMVCEQSGVSFDKRCCLPFGRACVDDRDCCSGICDPDLNVCDS